MPIVEPVNGDSEQIKPCNRSPECSNTTLLYANAGQTPKSATKLGPLTTSDVNLPKKLFQAVTTPPKVNPGMSFLGSNLPTQLDVEMKEVVARSDTKNQCM